MIFFSNGFRIIYRIVKKRFIFYYNPLSYNTQSPQGELISTFLPTRHSDTSFTFRKCSFFTKYHVLPHNGLCLMDICRPYCVYFSEFRKPSMVRFVGTWMFASVENKTQEMHVCLLH